jgi:hypothetical protein
VEHQQRRFDLVDGRVIDHEQPVTADLDVATEGGPLLHDPVLHRFVVHPTK